MRKVLQMLGVLDDHDIEWLISHGRTIAVAGDAVLIEEGQPIDAVYIILDGKMSVRRMAVADREIASLFPGEVVGEISFVDSRPPVASVVASQDSRVLSIPGSLIQQKLDRDHGFAARFYRALAIFLADRLRTTTVHLGFGAWDQDLEEMDGMTLDHMSVAGTRFDHLMKRLSMNGRA